MFPYNERMARYLHATERGDIAKIADQYKHLLTGDEGAEYDEVCTFPGVNILSKWCTYTFISSRVPALVFKVYF